MAEAQDQILGAIQPHGILAVINVDTLTIEAISENVESLLGLSVRELCGTPLERLVTALDRASFSAKLREPRLAALNPHDLSLCGVEGQHVHVEALVHRREGNRSIVEFEPHGSMLDRPSDTAAQAPIERLKAAGDIPALLAGAADDVRTISGFERAIIVQFDSNGQCAVVAESTAPDGTTDSLAPWLTTVQIAGAERHALLRTTLRLVPDTEYVAARIIATGSPVLVRAIDLSSAILGTVDADRLAALHALGCRSLLTISIIVGGRLWGLVACHDRYPRRLNYGKRAVCELISHLLALQLDARTRAQRLQRHAHRAALQVTIGAAIEASDDVGRATLEATLQIFELFGADGIALRLGKVIRRSGDVPQDDAAVIDTAVRLNRRAGNGVACENFTDRRGGSLFIGLTPDGGDFILLFRSAQVAAWTTGDLKAALSLRGRLETRLATRATQGKQQTAPVDRSMAARNPPADALIKLHEDIAGALPARRSIVEVILDFAQRQTHAGGSDFEILDDSTIVYEAAIGILAPYAGTRIARLGTLSDVSAKLNAPLLCDDATRELENAERDACKDIGVASMLVVPIAFSDTLTGVLRVVSSARAGFDDEDMQTLRFAATNLQTALRAGEKFDALAAAEREQRTYARQLRALHAIASTTTSNRKGQIDAALQLGLEQLDLDWAFLGVIDYAAHDFVIENSVCRNGKLIVEAGVRTRLDATIVGRVAHTKDVRTIQDVAQLDGHPAFAGWASNISVPLFIGGIHYGLIGFTSRNVRPQPFSAANIEFMAVAGELIASAIERGLQREKLEASETRYRALTEAMPAMVWVIDAGNHFEYVNARWTKYTGLTLEQSRGLGADGVYESAQLEILNSGRSRSPATEYDCEVRLRRYDGAFRWHLVRSVPFHDSAGDGGKWLVTATDIEERKSAEALMTDVHNAALAATEAKSRFLATMSHEIRTPMNAVIGMTELLLLTQLSEEQREYIEIVRDSGQSLLHVLNDILDYSKIEAGKLELEAVLFDLAGQIASVVELLRVQYQIKRVHLSTTIAPGVPAVVAGDPGRLRQVLLNLVGNSLKFTPEGGEVRIGVTASVAVDGVVPLRFTVEDTGIGIPPDVVARLFQPFSQGDESTTRKYGGTGLGLSICSQLVALMKGKIGVESTPNSGSTFWFEIPLGSATSSRAHEVRKRAPARVKPVVLRAERILLVEDNEINTFLAVKQLRRIGFAASAVSDGQQAVDAIERERFDLVFMDCHMPEMDGFAATREIRRLEAGTSRRLPIVAMTADARTEDHQNCLLAGMDDYISKPTSLESLRGVLDRWLPNSERRLSNRNALPDPQPAATIGFAKLLELFEGDRHAMMTLLTAASDSIKADSVQIETCAATHDYAGVAEAAQRLKGTSATIRSVRLGELSADLARAALTAPVAVSAASLKELRSAVDDLMNAVEKQGRQLALMR